MSYCNEVGEEVHLSTQLNISNTEALKFYARFADVSVLARELNMDQVKHIHEQIEQQKSAALSGKHTASKCSAMAPCAWRYEASAT